MHNAASSVRGFQKADELSHFILSVYLDARVVESQFTHDPESCPFPTEFSELLDLRGHFCLTYFDGRVWEGNITVANR